LISPAAAASKAKPSQSYSSFGLSCLFFGLCGLWSSKRSIDNTLTHMASTHTHP